MTTTSKAKPGASRPAATPQPVKAAAKPYIVFGADEYAKPRAATFWNANPAVLAKAVESLCLRMCEPTTAELRRVAKLLPPGKLEATGPNFLPVINGDLYWDLVSETAGDQQPPPAQSGNSKPLPRNWDEISAGHLVIVQESLECGWWEAIVIERTGDVLTLKYRDYPKCPKLRRHRSAVALISPPGK